MAAPCANAERTEEQKQQLWEEVLAVYSHEKYNYKVADEPRLESKSGADITDPAVMCSTQWPVDVAHGTLHQCHVGGMIRGGG